MIIQDLLFLWNKLKLPYLLIIAFLAIITDIKLNDWRIGAAFGIFICLLSILVQAIRNKVHEVKAEKENSQYDKSKRALQYNREYELRYNYFLGLDDKRKEILKALLSIPSVEGDKLKRVVKPNDSHYHQLYYNDLFQIPVGNFNYLELVHKAARLEYNAPLVLEFDYIFYDIIKDKL